MLRGAAILCPNSKLGFDIVVPFLRNGPSISRQNIGVLLVRVKNDRALGPEPQSRLFDAMDLAPRTEVFNESDCPRSVIRMVFAVGSKEAGCTILPPRESEPESKTDRSHPSYTAYDFWFAGLSPSTSSVIQEKEEEYYQRVLQHSLVGSIQYG